MGYNILVVSSLFPLPTSPHRGQFVSDQVRLLIKNGHDIRIVAPIPWLPKWAEKNRKNFKGVSKAPSYFDFEGIPVYSPRFLALPKQPIPSLSVATLNFSKNRVLKFLDDWIPDIVHIHTLFPICKLGLKLSQHYKIPLVATVHGWDFDFALNKKRLAKHQKRHALNLNKLITINESHKKLGVSLGISENNISIIPCHVDVLDKYHREFEEPKDLGNFSELKVLFPADPSRKEKDFPLFESVVNELENRSIKVEIQTLGGIDRESVWKLMNWADVAILTSSREGSPQVVKEAMKCGCRIISTNVGDVSNYLPSEVVVNQRTPEIIADVVKVALELPKESWAFPKMFESTQVISKLELVYAKAKSES